MIVPRTELLSMTWDHLLNLIWEYLLTIIAALIGVIVGIIQLIKWYRERQEERIDTFALVEKYAIRLLEKIEADKFAPDFVLGLGRSGAFLGGWLAGNLGSIPIEVVDRIHGIGDTTLMKIPHGEHKIRLLKKIYGANAKVLVVEAATTRGTTFYQFQEVRGRIAPEWQCKFCVLYEVKSNWFPVDFVGKQIKQVPRRYAWHLRASYKKALERNQN